MSTNLVKDALEKFYIAQRELNKALDDVNKVCDEFVKKLNKVKEQRDGELKN